MSQFNLVQSAPGCCTCGTTTGPFVDLQLPYVTVPTAIGPQPLTGPLYVCVGDEDHPGCVVQMARMSGQMVDLPSFRQLHDALDDANTEIAELRGVLAKRTLKIEDVLPLLPVG